MSRAICCRCGATDPTLAVIEAGREIDICRDCVREGDLLYIDTPAGDAVATVEPRCSL